MNSGRTIAKDWDKVMMGIVIGYIVLPIMLFCLGWLRFPIAVFCCLILTYIGKKIMGDVSSEGSVSITKNARFWLISLGAIALWVLFSGIGSFSFQSGDFWARNALYRELYQNPSWPVYCDITQEPEYVQNFTGGHTNALYVYYFTWWLPAALGARVVGWFGGGISS